MTSNDDAPGEPLAPEQADADSDLDALLAESESTEIEDAEDFEHPQDASEPVHPGPEVNVGHFERGASVTLGTALLALALSGARRRRALPLALLGGYLSWRGVTGRCAVYDALDTGSAEDEEDERLDAGAHDDVSLEAAATVARAPEEVYAFFRRLSNAPRFMAFVESVEEIDGTLSRWTARMPDGAPFGWESEILEDRPGELIAWRSQPGALVHHAGAVRLRPAPGGRGTEVRLDIEFSPPGVPLGRAVAALLGSGAEYAVEEDLRRLKQLLEAGETATTAGQPRCRLEPAARA
jgi:uncharacterized membrane protein